MDFQFDEIDFFPTISSGTTSKEEICGSASTNSVGMDTEFEQELDMMLGLKKLNSEDFQTPSFTKYVSRTEIMDISESTQHDSETKKNEFSTNHNCQKQTVSALKCLISEEIFSSYIQQGRELETLTTLWKDFLATKSRKTGKICFLSSLFNVDRKQPTKLQEYGFQTLFENFADNQIISAQNALREIAIIQMNEKAISEHIESRKLLRKQNFYYYLVSFRQALIDRNLKKRMSKTLAKNKAKALQIYECLA